MNEELEMMQSTKNSTLGLESLYYANVQGESDWKLLLLLHCNGQYQ
jgi:hypothetical protein